MSTLSHFCAALTEEGEGSCPFRTARERDPDTATAITTTKASGTSREQEQEKVDLAG